MVSKTDLKHELLKSFAAGALTEEFATMAMDVAQGHIAKNHWCSNHASRQDYLSSFCYRLMHKWRCINPEKNIHSFLTGMTNFAVLDTMRKNRRHSTKLKAFNQICTFYHPHQTNAQKRKYLGAVCC